jgi:hypothetical protein
MLASEVKMALQYINTNGDEMLVRVDENDKIIGKIEKNKAHADNTIYHRTALIIVFNSRGEVLLHQRSFLKNSGAGKWDIFGGHNNAGMTIEQTAESEFLIQIMEKVRYKLVQTETEDNLILSGLLAESKIKKTLCIYIHGYMSDFYTYEFPRAISEKVTSEFKDISVVHIQNRGTGVQTSFLKSDLKSYESIGSTFEMIPSEFDEYPISYQSFYSWYNDSEYATMWDFYKKEGYSGKVLQNLSLPVKIIVGLDDEFFYIRSLNTLQEVKNMLYKKIKSLDLALIEGGTHTFIGTGDHVASEVVKFLNNTK